MVWVEEGIRTMLDVVGLVGVEWGVVRMGEGLEGESVVVCACVCWVGEGEVDGLVNWGGGCLGGEVGYSCWRANNMEPFLSNCVEREEIVTWRVCRLWV